MLYFCLVCSPVLSHLPYPSLLIFTGYSESKVKSLLSRMRQSLKEYLEKEGVEL